MKCPICNKDSLQSFYVRQELEPAQGKRRRTFKASGLVCVNPECSYCEKSKPK